jgi:hypothetical protein
MSDLTTLDEEMTSYTGTIDALDRASDTIEGYVMVRFGPKEVDDELSVYLTEREGLDHDAVRRFAGEEVEAAIGRLAPLLPPALAAFAAKSWVRGLTIGMQLARDEDAPAAE